MDPSELYPLLGPYEALKKLSSTELSERYLGRLLGSEDFVQLDLIRARFSRDPAFVEVLYRELNPLLSLNHRNIRAVVGVEPVQDLQLVVSEFVHGVTLRTLIDRLHETARPTEPSIAAFIIAELCRGLEQAHTNTPEILHGELLPSEVHLSWEGKIKVGGFGRSETAERVRRADDALPVTAYAYMAPERLDGGGDARSDIYSAGVLLYELLTHHNPFLAETAAGTMQRVSELSPPRPSGFLSGAEPLDEICARALAKDPEERYESAQEMAIALSRAAVMALPENKRRGSRDIALASLMLILWPGQATMQPLPSPVDEVSVSALDEEADGPMGETLHGDEMMALYDPPTLAQAPILVDRDERTQINEMPDFLRPDSDPAAAPAVSDPTPTAEPPAVTDPEVAAFAPTTAEPPAAPSVRPASQGPAAAKDLVTDSGAWRVPPAIDADLASKLWEELSPAGETVQEGHAPRFASGLDLAPASAPHFNSGLADPGAGAPAPIPLMTLKPRSQPTAPAEPPRAQPAPPPAAVVPPAPPPPEQPEPPAPPPPRPPSEAEEVTPAMVLTDAPPRSEPPPVPSASGIPIFASTFAPTGIPQPLQVPAPIPPPPGRSWWKLGAATFALAALAGAGALMLSEGEPEAKLYIRSEPPGASVIVSGVVQKERTPMTLPVKLDHKMQVSLHMPGYIPVQRTLQVTNLENAMKVRLQPSTGSITVLAKPEAAQIFLDGVEQGRGTVTIGELPLDRPLQLRIIAEGHAPVERTVQLDVENTSLTLEEALRPLEKGELQQVKVTLRAPPGRWVDVYRGKLRLGTTPLSVSLDTGDNRLRVVNETEGLDRVIVVNAPQRDGATIELQL